MKCFLKSLFHLNRPSSILWLYFSCTGCASHGGSIQWGSGVSDTLFDADAAQMPSGFLWELGTFGNSFTPTEQNLTLWQANWKPVEQASWGAGANGGWWTEESDFTGNTTTGYTWVPGSAPDPAPGSNANAWAAGERFYIWAYNSKRLSTTSEWALVTGETAGNTATNWVLPADFDQSSVNYQWRISQATTVVFGGLRDFNGPGETTQPSGPFDLQSARLPADIPEPSVWAITIVGLALSGSLRHRKAVSFGQNS